MITTAAAVKQQRYSPEQMTSYVLQAKHRDATEEFCGLLGQGEPLRAVMGAAIDASAPYLNVPAHIRSKNGEPALVNYDHTVLAWRGSLRLMRYLPEGEALLPMAQAMWYVPQGLDVWGQVHGRFPGHYQGKSGYDFPIPHPPNIYFPDQEPLTEGTPDERLEGMNDALLRGDRVEAYRLFLGLADEPGYQTRLEDAILRAGIFEMQETIANRRTRSTGHKALRARAMVEIGQYLGWENSHSLHWAVVPDIPTAPLFYELFDYVSSLCAQRLKEHLPGILRSRRLLTEEEIAATMTIVIEGSREAVIAHVTDLLKNGKSLIAVADALTAAAQKWIAQIVHPNGFFMPGHVHDYLNVVNFWIRTYKSPHAIKALYHEAIFINDVAMVARQFPAAVPSADSPPLLSVREDMNGEDLLRLLATAITEQNGPEAVAATTYYLRTRAPRLRLLTTLARGASHFQNDPHIQRFCGSTLEEWEQTTARSQRHWALIALANYLACSSKRSTALDCSLLYGEHFNTKK